MSDLKISILRCLALMENTYGVLDVCRQRIKKQMFRAAATAAVAAAAATAAAHVAVAAAATAGTRLPCDA